MPGNDLIYTGHYVDDEIVKNIKSDSKKRMKRKKDKKPMRFLLTIGGAGAQKEIFEAIIKHLLPAVKKDQAAIFVNVGDYRNVWDELVASIDGMKDVSTEHFEDFAAASEFSAEALEADVTGIHGFYHSNIFEAVYITNLLMRCSDVLVTKPSELSFYPVPKLFIRRVGKHEMWGAIHSAEVGDGTLECRDIPHILQMTDMFLHGDRLLSDMTEAILSNNKAGLYDGAYKVVEKAFELRKKEK